MNHPSKMANFAKNLVCMYINPVHIMSPADLLGYRTVSRLGSFSAIYDCVFVHQE